MCVKVFVRGGGCKGVCKGVCVKVCKGVYDSFLVDATRIKKRGKREIQRYE